MKIENEILYGDATKIIKELPDNFIDFVLTDPPYGTNDNKKKNIRRGNKDVDFSVIKWDKELLLNWISELPRIMKDDTWGVIFTDKKEITTVWSYLESIKLNPRNTFYWIKTNKAPTPRKNFKSCVETAVVFTKGRTNKKWYGSGNENNYLLLPFVSGKEHAGHPTQKPIKLFEYFIKLFSIENDLVFDPFIGSGTTAECCFRLDRKYLGIELNELEYRPIIENRLKRYNSINKKLNNKSFNFFK